LRAALEDATQAHRTEAAKVAELQESVRAAKADQAAAASDLDATQREAERLRRCSQLAECHLRGASRIDTNLG
jgi:multidrug resistance efflux pump